MSIKITSNQALAFVSKLKRQLVSGSSEAWLLRRRRALCRLCPQRWGTILWGLSTAGAARCPSQGPSTAPGTASPEPGPGNPVRSSWGRARDKAPGLVRAIWACWCPGVLGSVTLRCAQKLHLNHKSVEDCKVHRSNTMHVCQLLIIFAGFCNLLLWS